MSSPILATKFYITPLQPNVVLRPRLVEKLNEGLHRKLTLISAPAGFGKTTLVNTWVASFQRPAAWLSLDEGDNDPTRFLTYLVAALQKMVLPQTQSSTLGEGVLRLIQSSPPPPSESILTSLINDISAIPDSFVLVLDDYHIIDAKPVDQAITFLLEHLPRQMHLVITTREDPALPLARYRARGQLTELRIADLRFTNQEAAGFLNEVMGLHLPEDDIAALETRTEGWIAGLQLAALALQGASLQGVPNTASFIQSFTGSHHFILDYLVEEVLNQQADSVQSFLLHTSILDRLCGPLCDAILQTTDSQQTLEYLERANLFTIPLDNERCWFRYHHLFADAMRQRLHQSVSLSSGIKGVSEAELHIRASQWYEENGLEIEAFQHAAAAQDIERAERLMEGGGMPLHFRGAMMPVLYWLESLPRTVLDARPSLWVTYASALTMAGQPISTVEQKLQAAEAALQAAESDEKAKDLIGHIAAIRAMLAIPQNQVDIMVAQSRRALTYLSPKNLPVRTITAWTLGLAYQRQGDRAAASQAYSEAISISQASGNIMITIAATTCLGQIRESENQLYLAEESYRHVLKLAGDPPLPAACEASLGLARVLYQWNDLVAAQLYGQQSLQLARQMTTVDTTIACEVFLARLKLAQGNVVTVAEMLEKASQIARRHDFASQLPAIEAVQVLIQLRLGKLTSAIALAKTHNLTYSLARVYLAQGDTSAALALLEPIRREAESKGWADERLQVMLLQAVALDLHGEKDEAVHLLGDALALAQPGGFIRIFVDEGLLMARLLRDAFSQGFEPEYICRLLGAFPGAELDKADSAKSHTTKSGLVETLSERELEVLQLIGKGLTNQEIASHLYLSLNTVKVHTRNINGKLDVSSRTKAVAKARDLGILPSDEFPVDRNRR